MKSVVPYLNFDGSCREAMAFYQQALGGDLTMMTYGESAKLDATHGSPPPGAEDRLIHARLVRGDFVLMASDCPPGMSVQPGTNVWLSIGCEDDAEVDRLFPALNDGGQAIMPPHDAFWGARFAMCVDRFGMRWMLNHERAPAGAAA